MESRCVQCGSQLGSDKYCAVCGTANTLPSVKAGKVFSTPQKEKQKKPVNKSKLILLLSVCMVLLIAGVVLTGYLVTEAGKASDYDNATALMEDGRYTEALEIFNDLGTYHDASELMLECQNAIGYNAAKQHMDSGRFQEAKSAFEALGDFGDSRMMAIDCRKGIDYALAMEVMSSRDFAGAKTLFEALIPYKDSASFAAECGNGVIYVEAMELMNAGNYADAIIKLEPLAEQGFEDCPSLVVKCYDEIDYGEAIEMMDSGRYRDAINLLEPLAKKDFRNSVELRNECKNFVIYAKADSAYDDEHFYTAYTLFKSISGFSDSYARADSCVQDYPETGEIYRNISGKAVSLKFKTPGDDPRPTFLTIYTADNEHVSSVFIRSGDSPTIKLPEGTYYINMAYGENWFGPGDMFGDDAEYQTLQLDRDIATITIESKYIYTFRLRTDTHYTDHQDAHNEDENLF